MKPVMLNGREVDTGSLVLETDGEWDYPDFCDAYISDGTFVDGIALKDEELYELTDNSDLMAELVERKFF